VRAAGAESLTVGFYGSAASALLPETLRRFAAEHPSIVVTVRELLLGSLADLETGAVDVAFTRLLPGQADVEVRVVAEEPRVAALPAAHPLAGATALSIADLRDERFITNPVDAGPPARWLEEQRRHGLPAAVAATAASVQEILTLVAAGRGICLVPAPIADQSSSGDVAFVPVRDADPAVVSLAWRGDARPVVRTFIETAARVAASVQRLSAGR
jgi:DNA-binding transcriptional LysR family regulator